MRVLIIGGGGREHALAWRLAQSPLAPELFASPGNPGIARLAICLPAPKYLHSYAGLAETHRIDLTVVGPEVPLVAGLVDNFRSCGLKIVGPTRAAALLEGSKLFAKEFFFRAGIPTARSITSINASSFPLVIKADGLAAGKGVVIAQDRSEAEEALRRLGPDVILEEYLEGEEVSFIGLS
ncbi:MAG: phosphoribosylamine--glycine ligase, partial [Acidobacteriota bacterium]|nr:phosphoribosylamine--glycine ligase [Acidobacteriota bacterium]